MTLEELRKGSDIHRVSPTSNNGFKIRAANDGEECKQRFHDLVTDLDANWPDGYGVDAHPSSTEFHAIGQ
jgi:hypothetical protein